MNLPLNIDLQQVFLHLLNFTLLFAILYFLLYKPVKAFSDKRTEEYKKADEEAKRLLSEAAAHEKEYADKLSFADEEIRKKKAEARKEMNDAAEAETKKAKLEAEKILQSAKAEAENRRARMLSDAKSELSDMVLEATEKIVEKSTSDAYDHFLDAANSGGDEQ